MLGCSTDCKKTINALSLVAKEKAEIKRVPAECKKVGPTKVRVRVAYWGVNFCDIILYNRILIPVDLPFILGNECSGIVTEVGESVKDLYVDECVMVFCPFGGLFQEEIIIDEMYIFKCEESMNLAIGAAMPACYLTAHYALKHINKKSTVLFHGCAGGVGRAVSDLVNNDSLVTLLGTCSAEKLKDEQSSKNIFKTYKKENVFPYDTWVQEISERYSTGIDAVIDTRGGHFIPDSLKILRPGGILIIIGASLALEPGQEENLEKGKLIDTRTLIEKNLHIYALNLQQILNNENLDIKLTMNSLMKKLSNGEINPQVFSVLHFTEFQTAFDMMLNRKNTGKIILKVNVEE